LNNRNQRTIIGVVLAAIIIVAMGVVFLIPPPEVPTPLDPVPPSVTPPENTTSVETIQVGSLILNATATVSGMIPHSGLITYNLELVINITNTGSENVSNFHAIKMSVYKTDSSLFYTFSIQPDSNVTIPAGGALTLTYQNQETGIDASGALAEAYTRVLVTFDPNHEVIITTPIMTGIFAIE